MGFDQTTKHRTTTTSLGPGQVGEDIHIREQQSAGTHGGTFTSGAWRTRTLNTIVTDETGNVTLSSNQITLPAGTYRANIEAPVQRVLHCRARLRNVTDGTDVLLSNSIWTDNGVDSVQTASTIYGQFTIGASKTLEVQHWGTETEATTGFGQANSIDSKDEIHTTVEFVKVA